MKRRNVVLSEDAFADVEGARAFYDRQESGLGDYFLSCLVADLEALSFFAGIHARRLGHHRMLAKRFPFAIYYDVDEALAIVVAVLDMRRSPSAIKNRLADP
jgi:hypothetical protein